jgi:xanthine dehydrogenase YagS FAD-binding subunit
MRPFTFVRPSAADEAVRAVAGDPEAVFLAGGTDLVDHLRLGVARLALVVDVRTATSREVTGASNGGLRIGVAATNSELAADRRVREHYPVLAQALLSGASGQLCNMATSGGNPLQRRVPCSRWEIRHTLFRT